MDNKKVVLTYKVRIDNLSIQELVDFASKNPEVIIECNDGEAFEKVLVITTESKANELKINEFHNAQRRLLEELHMIKSEKKNLLEKIQKLENAKQVQTFPKP